MSNYRQEFIRANPGKKRFGKPGYWYRCAHCGKWCARPGGETVLIPDEIRMEVDHIRPWSQGGTHELYNLQPSCKPCNRSKSASSTTKDNFTNVKNAVLHPVDTFIKTPVRKAYRQNKVLKKLGINKRK